MESSSPALGEPARRLPRNVRLLGMASLLNDIASEMIFPLVPKFVEQVLKASLKELALIEGVAESIASLMKLGAGGWSDRVGRRKPFIFVGYLLAALARPAIGLATLPWQVLAARAGDRFGKGLRSAARDALIVESVASGEKGRAFAFRQAMDHIGAMVGPLLALFFLWWFPGEFRWLFLITLVPGVVVILLLLGLREVPASPRARPRLHLSLVGFSSGFRRFLLALGLFTLACSSDAFLLVWASRLGAADWELLFFWAIFSAAKAAGNLWVGSRVDRLGAWRFVLCGWLLYAGCYLAFSFATSSWQVWTILLVYAGYYSLTEPAEKTLIAELAGPRGKGLAFGWFHFTLGVVTLPASLIFASIADALEKDAGPRLAFQVGAGLALAAAATFWAWVPRTNDGEGA